MAMAKVGNRQVELAKVALLFMCASIGFSFLIHSPQLWFLGILPAIVLGLIWLSVQGERIDKREITPRRFADELERHLLDPKSRAGWNEISSLPILDKRLYELRSSLMKLNSLASKDREEQLQYIISALRQGEIPDIRK
jgi:hypothetical protein